MTELRHQEVPQSCVIEEVQSHLLSTNFASANDSIFQICSMASIGVHTNGSQFYMSLSPMAHLNGRCVVFARIIKGQESIDAIEKVKNNRNHSEFCNKHVHSCGLYFYFYSYFFSPTSSEFPSYTRRDSRCVLNQSVCTFCATASCCDSLLITHQ